MLKQKIVMHVDMSCDKCQKKCRKIAASTDGFLSMSVEMEKSHLIITGVGIDSSTLANSLKKKVGSTSILSIEIIKTEAQKKEEENKKKIKEVEEEEENKKKIKEVEEEEEKRKTLTWSYNYDCPCSNYAPPTRGCELVYYGAAPPSYPTSWFN